MSEYSSDLILVNNSLFLCTSMFPCESYRNNEKLLLCFPSHEAVTGVWVGTGYLLAFPLKASV